jgi:hypothetical protein
MTRAAAPAATGLEAVAPAAPPPVFSAFDEAQVARALSIAADFMRIANERPPEQALDAVLDAYSARTADEEPGLLEYALLVFITHHPRGTALTHAVPSLTLRHPNLVAPSGGEARSPFDDRDAGSLEAVGDPTAFAGGAVPPDGLEWWREDPFANEHHIHWHVVYPLGGLPNPANPSQRIFKDRQGEVFFYMHQQMLARYDAERVALGLPRVSPHADYLQPIATGYDPGPILAQQGFSRREAQRRMMDVPPSPGRPGFTVAQQIAVRDHVRTALAARAYTFLQPPVPMTDVALFGATVEANGAGIGRGSAPISAHYGSLHNQGHNQISRASSSGTGVMVTPATAIRDPVFWEWHKHVDDFYAAWQDGGPPQAFDDRPPVRIRKSFDGTAARSLDILFAFEDALPAGALADLDAWGEAAFGGAQWDIDFTGAGSTTDTLETTMLRRRMVLADRFHEVPVDHLTHRPFVYALRIENQAAAAAAVTARVFIAPIAAVPAGTDDRRTWIEMDKFVVRLAAGQKKVAVRRGAQSSVIRKPAEMRPQLLKEFGIRFSAQQLAAMQAQGLPPAIAATLAPHVDRDLGLNALRALLGASLSTAGPFLVESGTVLESEQPVPPADDADTATIDQTVEANYCTCGWPYNLLLPRGTTAGMPFRLIVVCSDLAIDQVGGDEGCGSLSFCGARDQYPDRRRMGYPFDQPFADAIPDVVMANASMAFRDFTIRRQADVDTDD